MRRLAALILLLALTTSCGWGEIADQNVHRVIPRPDGVLVIYQQNWSRKRFRMPMDHGSATVDVAAVHQAFLYPADGSAPRAVPLDLAVDYNTLAPGLRPDLPVLRWRQGGLVAQVCRETQTMVLDCGGIPGGNIRQVHGRIEDVALTGDRLVLARGPDGSTNCTIDLTAIDRPPTQPDWVLAHYPDTGSYLFDRSDPALALYRLQCGQAPQLLERLAVEGAQWTEVIDIVPGADAANPLVLYSSHNAFEQVKLRNRAGDLAVIETGALERGNAFFLDASGARIVVADDGIFRRTPGLELILHDVASGERRTLTWNHAYAAWPERP